MRSLTNATQEVKGLMTEHGTTGLLLSGHSRGGMTIGNALESMGNEPEAKGSMANAEINLYGSAYNAAKAGSYMAQLQGTKGNKKNNAVTSTVHFADFVGTVIGGNAPTGGTLPLGPDGEPISQFQEAFNILFGSVTAHSCYGSGKAGCEAYWNNSPSAKP